MPGAEEAVEQRVDNLCHTLVGAALAQAGLKRRTRYGMATLLIGANLPDVDALTYLGGGGLTALSFRRGWTHGILALAVLPWVLTGLVWAWHRLLGRRKSDGGAVLHLDQVALLAVVSVLTHPVLDYLNTYGMRWLMPFVNRWYYADGLFIADPWIWLLLGAGVILSSRRDGERGEGSRNPAGRPRPAVVALVVVAAYAVAMAVGSAAARGLVRRELMAVGLQPARVLASPVPLNPFRRAIVIDQGDSYRFGTVNWLRRPAFTLDSLTVRVNRLAPASREAARSPQGRVFLGWARFPFFIIEPTGLVHIVDARYTLDPAAEFGSVTIRR